MNEKIHELSEIVRKLDFEVNNIFHDLSDIKLSKIYNGCGPEWLPEYMRDALTWYYSFFEAAFLEHDVSFTISDGSEKGFKEANNRLFKNCIKLSNQLSWFSNPITKIRRYRQSYTIYKMCKKFGWSAYKSASNIK